MEKIIKIASAKSIYLLSDEVFAPIFHSFEGDEVPPSALTLGYERTIVTGSMTKSFSLAGLRIGWIATPNAEVLERCFEARDYTTITCSIISDNLAAYALNQGTVDNILKRNIALAKKNVQILDDFVKKHPGKISWVRPKAGTTGFVRFYKDGKPVEDDRFCEDVTTKCGAYFCPGKFCFGNNVDFQGYTRIGYVCATEVLVKGLEALGKYIEQEL
jgi:aspartate/methionine/tyrosine aminotransferase